MRFISTIVILAVLLLAAVHVFFYMSVGTIEPCQAGVLRVIQKQRDQGNEAIATLGTAFRQPAEDLLRAEGIAACYRTALTGQAPEQLTLKFNLRR